MAKILIVEDEPDIMLILTDVLRAAGFDVLQAYGGDDAIRKVATYMPDLVLTDLAMPHVTGVEVIEAIKGDPQLSSIPVIAITAHMWDGIAQSAGRVGCDAYISKPFSNKKLVQEIRKHLKMPPA